MPRCRARDYGAQPGKSFGAGRHAMKLTEEQRATIHRIRRSEEKDFMTLVRIAGLNPKSDFRYANLSGMDFGYADLRGFDFTGADLRGADLRSASIEGAIFTDADTIG